jgi:hypothetical protein
MGIDSRSGQSKVFSVHRQDCSGGSELLGPYSPISRDGYPRLPIHQWWVRTLNPNFHFISCVLFMYLRLLALFGGLRWCASLAVFYIAVGPLKTVVLTPAVLLTVSRAAAAAWSRASPALQGGCLPWSGRGCFLHVATKHLHTQTHTSVHSNRSLEECVGPKHHKPLMQIDKQTDRQTDRQTDTHTHTHTQTHTQHCW